MKVARFSIPVLMLLALPCRGLAQVAATTRTPFPLAKLKSEDPRSTRFVSVLAVNAMPKDVRRDARAVIYIRPNRFPAILVLIREHGGAPEDLEAGYVTAMQMVRALPAQSPSGERVAPLTRAVTTPSQLRALTGSSRAAYEQTLRHLLAANQVVIEGVGTGRLLRIAKPRW